MELDTKSISILNKPRKTVTSPRLLTINHERQKPLFCPKTLARQALEPQVFRPESLPKSSNLSKVQRQENRTLATQRIVIEHVNRKLKIFRILSERYRNRRRRFGLRFNLIAGIYNYELNLS